MSLLKRLKPESDEFLRLDFLRFIAASGVVLLHFRDRLGLPADVMAGIVPFNLFVDLFFVISGIVITHTYRNRVETLEGYGRFLWARVARLGPLHWLTVAFYVLVSTTAVALHVPVYKPTLYSWDCLAPNLLFIHAWGTCSHESFNYASWSISAEMAVYIAFPVIVLLGRRLGALSLVGLSLLGLAILYATASGQSGTLPWWDWTYHFGVVRAVPAFLFGSALYLTRDRIARIIPAAGLTWIALAAFFILAFLGLWKGWLVLLMYAIPTFALAADTRVAPTPTFLRLAALGQLTYSIYMLHPVAQLVLVAGERVIHIGSHAAIFVTIAALLAIYPASYLSLMLVESPARRWLNGLIGRRKLVAAPERPAA